MTKQTSIVWISRIFEEVIPFIPYLVRSRRKRRQAECKNILNKKNFAEYRELSEQQILCRLTEERLRASAMDEKTFKLSLSLSVGLTFLGLAATLLIKAIGYATVQIILTSFIGPWRALRSYCWLCSGRRATHATLIWIWYGFLVAAPEAATGVLISRGPRETGNHEYYSSSP